MKFCLYFLVSVYFSLCGLALPLAETEDYKPPVHQIVEGDNLLIVCNATQTKQNQIYWKKNDISGFRQNGTELKILNINRKEAGDYVCYSLNLTSHTAETNGTVIEIVNIDVLYPAEVTSFYLGPNVLREGSTFSIDCDIVGNPDPVWSLMNKRTNASMLTANKAAGVYLKSWPVTCADTGFWMCTGHNYLNHKKNTTQGSNVTVFCSPSPKGDIKYRIQSAPRAAVNLIMKNDGYPYPNYTWSFNGKALPSNMSFSQDTSSILIIHSVQPKDFGNYTLTMKNSIGTYKADYQLIPNDDAPLPPIRLYYTDVTSNSVKLHWTSGYDMGHRQYFVIMKWIGNEFIQISNPVYDDSPNHGIGDNFSHVVTGLESSTYYKLSVAARNGYGSGAFSREYVEFTTRYNPEIPTEFHHNTTGIIIGCTMGGLTFIGFLAFIVYIVFYRRMQTSYETMKGKTFG